MIIAAVLRKPQMAINQRKIYEYQKDKLIN